MYFISVLFCMQTTWAQGFRMSEQEWYKNWKLLQVWIFWSYNKEMQGRYSEWQNKRCKQQQYFNHNMLQEIQLWKLFINFYAVFNSRFFSICKMFYLSRNGTFSEIVSWKSERIVSARYEAVQTFLIWLGDADDFVVSNKEFCHSG
jgi:hypothetical protein